MSELGRSFGTVLLSAKGDGRVNSVASPSLEPFLRDWIGQKWPERSVRGPRLLSADQQGWVRDHDIISEQEVDRLPEYTEFLVPRGLKWAAAAAIRLPTSDMAIISMERKIEQGPFEVETIAVLNSLYGHLARAAMLSSLVSFDRTRTAIEMLEALGLPAAAIASNGNISPR